MVKSSKSRMIFAILGIGIIIIVCIFFILSDHSATNDGVDSVSEAGITTQYVSGLLAPKDEDDLIRESSLVIHGKISGQSEAFKIVPVFGDSPSIFTDYYVEIFDVLRGEVGDVTQPISVRVQGGIADDLEVVAEDAPEFTVGDEVLLFLYQPNMGAAYNTEGDYYYVLGLSQGAYFKEDNTDTYSTELNIDIVLSEFAEEINALNEEFPIDENNEYNTLIENLKKNIETGFITQEEYEDFVAETHEYATIID